MELRGRIALSHGQRGYQPARARSPHVRRQLRPGDAAGAHAAGQKDRRLRVPWTILLFLAGLVPAVLAAYYYAAVLGLGPATAAWNAVLMLAGGSVSVMSAVEWSVVLGCVISLAMMIVWIARQPRPQPTETAITVRGPITYAGPGSLGATRSALRR